MGDDSGLHAGRRRPRRGRRARGLPRLVGDARARSAPSYLNAIAAGLGERAEELDRDDHPGAGDAAEAHPDRPGRAARSATSPRCREAIEEVAGRRRSATRGCSARRSACVGAITPWNYPLNQIVAKVAPALAAGCTVVLKPSEVAPLNAFILAEVIESVGLPARRLQPGHRDRPGRRRGDRRPPRRRHGLLHRLHPRRPPRHRARRGDGEAGRDGARRQVAERDPRRRRLRPRRPRRRRQVLPQLGPDLQRADPDAGPARASSPRSRSWPSRRPRRSPPATRSRPRTRLGPLVSDTPARARPRLHPQGRGRGREAD